MAIDKITVERDTEEWQRLSERLTGHFEEHKELIKVEEELFFLIRYPYTEETDEELIKRDCKALVTWSQRAFKQGLREYSDDLKLFQSLCKKLYLDQELYVIFLELLPKQEKEEVTPLDPEELESDEVYGIDLGTTNSCIAQMDVSGNAIVKPNIEGMNTTPSVISYEEGTDIPFVGNVAKEALISDPLRTVAFIKRDIGNDDYESKCEVKDSPVKISAYILKKLVTDVNTLENKNIKNVVITCPAYFGTKEREQTKQAGLLAGLNVLTLINEPTAAAISYGISLSQDKNILVYDLGGGTFDVSILSTKAGEIEVIATGGDHHLGGIDWDLLLAKHIAKEANIDINFDDNRQDKEHLMLKNMLLISAEQCKKNLRTRNATTVNIPYKGETKRIEITLELFDQLTSVLLEQTIEKMKEVIEIANNKGYSRINEYLLVGGSSRMLQIKKRVDAEFGCNAKLTDPDMAVAKGAAIYGHSLLHPDAKTPVITDTSSNSYGIGCYNKEDVYVVRNLIKAQTEVTEFSRLTFRTVYNNQSSLLVEVFEGNSMEDENDILDSTLLEKMNIDLKKPYPKDFPFTLEFQRNKEGILSVHVQIDDLKWDAELKLKGVLDKDELDKTKKEIQDTQVG
ncbi:Hsp70 family protein [Parabacteroides sp.]